MDHQIELGYLVLGLPEPDTVAPVLAEVIGLVPGEPAADGLTWRDADRAQRLVVEPGPANDAVAIGFEAVDTAAFDATVERLRAIGADVEPGSDDDLERRRVSRLVRVASPWGVVVEVVLGLADAPTPFAST